MVRTASYMSVVLFVVTSCAVAGPTAAPAAVRITNSHLVATCLDGKPSQQRKWDLPERQVTMTFTMRNQPRVGRSGADAGFASIAFTPEPGHVYEIEVHSDPSMYSTRVWPRGEWTPVVRDRTTDRIVSGDPQWTDAATCASTRSPG